MAEKNLRGGSSSLAGFPPGETDSARDKKVCSVLLKMLRG